ncbi:MAG: FAD:protein FMN transferase [bacterium]|nr:FAD:protein FMN transferase [bacterium]
MTVSHFRKLLAGALIFLCGPRLLFAQTANSRLFEVRATQTWLGTRVDLLAQHESIQACKQAFYEAFHEMARLEKLLSAELPASEMSQVNQKAGRMPVKVSHETLRLINRFIGYSQKFNGLFGVANRSQEALWGAHGEKNFVTAEYLQSVAVLPPADYTAIIIDERDTTVAFSHKSMQLVLDYIVRGYAIDRAAVILKQQGIKNFLINAGGDIYAAGHRDLNKKWRVGIQHPRHPQALMASFELSDGAVATNGDYENSSAGKEGSDGQLYPAFFAHRSSAPAPPCQSVSVLATSAEEAEAWAAYLFAIGFEAYKKITSPSMPAALFVDAGGKIHWEAIWEKNYQLKFLD